MLVNAILERLLHNRPWDLFLGFLILCAIVGFVSSLLPALLFQLLALTPKAKARRKRDLNAELQRKYEGICSVAHELRQDNESLAAENVRLVGLLREEHSHNRDWDIRARRELEQGRSARA